MTSQRWISDAPVSTPTPNNHDDEAKVPMGGFCFTPDGLAFDLSETDLEATLTREANDVR